MKRTAVVFLTHTAHDPTPRSHLSRYKGGKLFNSTFVYFFSSLSLSLSLSSRFRTYRCRIYKSVPAFLFLLHGVGRWLGGRRSECVS
ncbi:hypothetical protein BU26DRAFT_288690 [Trematosphaeria pertusa]|uniref:Uncharacterized protein n=1 Tax=Trematosphaeria pertusa TaxID=390896 RepID=A0A6A6II58_9PLEO|nr:uncharacterized protein BU26DRAFT_288690 [Trematosphaeria pertusa]KAF2249728.1 hypothetical protein BU26DRAFT_288690 [Trematosphaeria pertusa]